MIHSTPAASPAGAQGDMQAPGLCPAPYLS